MTKKLHVVLGATGEWSDRMEWLVAAFDNRSDAEAYVSRLVGEYQNFDQRLCGYSREDRDALEDAMSKLDPQFMEDYTGTHWFISEVNYHGLA